MIKITFYLFLLTLGMTNVFSIGGFINFPVFFAFLGISFSLAKIIIIDKKIKKPRADDLAIICSIALSFLSLAYSISYSSTGNNSIHVIYFASLMASFLAFYYFPLIALGKSSNLVNTRKALFGGLIISSIIVLTEILGNLGLYDFSKYLYRGSVEDYSSTALGSFSRIRGGAEESGHFALYVIVAMCLACAAYFNSISKTRTLIISLGLSLITLSFSVAALIELLLGFFLFLLITKPKDFFRYIKNHKISFASVAAVIFIIALSLGDYAFELVQKKMTDSYSLSYRVEVFNQAINLLYNSSIIQILLGNGPGHLRAVGAPLVLNAYMLLTIDYGFIFIVLFLWLLVLNFKRILKISDGTQKLFMILAFISVVFHLIAIPNYWYPWPWLTLAFIRHFSEEKSQHIN